MFSYIVNILNTGVGTNNNCIMDILCVILSIPCFCIAIWAIPKIADDIVFMYTIAYRRGPLSFILMSLGISVFLIIFYGVILAILHYQSIGIFKNPCTYKEMYNIIHNTLLMHSRYYDVMKNCQVMSY